MSKTQTTSHPAPNSARLVQLMSALGDTAVREPHECFAARLARLFDLSETIALDAAYKREPAGPFGASERAAERLRTALPEARDALVDAITQSFSAAAPAGTIRLPRPGNSAIPGKRPAFKSYERFYLAQQRQLASGVGQLRMRARKLMAEQSATLAKLAELDAIFDDTLANYARQCFGALPSVLQARYRTLWQAHRATLPEDDDEARAQDAPERWMETGGWLYQFCQEMQMLLLSELEVRLEPVQGLLDAFNNEVSDNP